MSTVVYDDFRRGEFGDLGPRLAGQMGPGWFTGKNVMRYRSGLVGPRPGLREWTITGGTLPNGLVRCLFWSQAGFEDTFVVIGTAARMLRPDHSAEELDIVSDFGGGTIPSGETAALHGQHRTDGNWVIVPGVGLYKADIDGDTVTTITTTITGRAIQFNRARLLAADGSTTPYRTWFSDAGNETNWDDFNDYFDGTYFNAITGYYELRNGLIIAQSTPHLEMVTGTIGTSSSVLRRISTHTAPMDPMAAASVGGELLVMMGRNRTYPEMFNGATWESLRHLSYQGDDWKLYSPTNSDKPANCVLPLESGWDWIILSGTTGTGENKALLQWDDSRSYHTFEADVRGFGRVFANGAVLLTDGGDAAAPPKFWSWEPGLGRPGFTSDVQSSVGDDSDTPLDAYLYFPEEWDKAGREILVRGLVIDFTKWATGASATNHFEVTVEAFRRYGDSAVVTSTVQTFDEAGASATTDGVKARVHMHFGDQGYGGGFRVKIDDIRGVAFESIVALTETRDSRI